MADRARWFLFVLLLSAILGSLSVLAQTTDGALQGKVTDEAGQPVAGAAVEIRGPALQAYLGTATDPGGEYKLPFVPVGRDYDVKVEAPGYATVIRKGVEVRLGTTAILPFILGPGKTEVVVTAASPLVDSRKTEVGANISDRMIEAIPLERNAAGIAYLAPGVVESGLADNPAISGASGPENSYMVNGVDTASVVDGTNQGSLNFDFIEATEVKTGGLDAEYGALMGGMVNSITKSGGNEFHGSVFAYYFDDGLGAKERLIDYPGIVESRMSFKQYDVGATLGGYFIKDKLWFYAAYDYNRAETGYYGDSQGDLLVSLNGRPAYSWSKGQTYTETETNPQYAFKLTWNVSANHKLALSVFGNDYKAHYARELRTLSEEAAWAEYTSDTYAVSLQWNATWTRRFFTEAVLSRRQTETDDGDDSPLALRERLYYYRYSGYAIIPTSPPNAYNPDNGAIDLASWDPSYGRNWWGNSLRRNDQLRLKATNLFQGLGRHELSYGLQLYDIKFDDYHTISGAPFTELWPGNLFYGHTTTTGCNVRWQYSALSPSRYWFRAGGVLSDPQRNTTQNYSAYWVQDNWNLTEHFMLKLGLRLDQIHMKGGDNEITANLPDRIVPGRGYTNGKAQRIDINDEWAPRLGFTWDVTHDGKSKLYGFYGMYYERIPNYVALRALTDEIIQVSYFTDAALTQPFPNPDYHYTTGLYDTVIEGGPDGSPLKGSYTNEWLLGFQYEFRPDWSVGVRAIYRDIGRVVDDINLEGFTADYILTNPDQWTDVWYPDPYGRPGYRWRTASPIRIYKGLQITLDKRFSDNWMMQGSYVLSRLQGNYEGLFLNDTQDLGTNIGPTWDGPDMMVNAYGLLPNDRTHVLKLYGAYFFENIPLALSGKFLLASGTPTSKLGYARPYGDYYGYCTPRGSGGRTPTVWTLDVGAQYTFKIWKSLLALRVDVFNVFNNQVTTAVDQLYNWTDTTDDQTWPYYGKETAHQPGRRMRVAIKWTF
jgi:hypothetical protein